MTSIGFGDLAQNLMMRKHNAHLNTEVSRRSEELTTGEITNKAKHLAGDYSHLAGVERSLKMAESFRVAASEAELFTSTLQDVLGGARETVQAVAKKLLTVTDTDNQFHRDAAADDAESAFVQVVGLFNTQIGGRSVLAGTATDGKPLTDAEEMLDMLRQEIASATSAGEAQNRIASWFSDPTGFAEQGYLGADENLDSMPVAENQTIDIPVRADADALRETLRDLAMVALMDEDVFASDQDTQRQIVGEKATALLARDAALVDLQGRVGSRQEAVDRAITRNEAERLSFMEARQSLIGIEPFEAAVALKEAETQLESLYTVTARMSRLTLSNFLR